MIILCRIITSLFLFFACFAPINFPSLVVPQQLQVMVLDQAPSMPMSGDVADEAVPMQTSLVECEEDGKKHFHDDDILALSDDNFLSSQNNYAAQHMSISHYYGDIFIPPDTSLI